MSEHDVPFQLDADVMLLAIRRPYLRTMTLMLLSIGRERLVNAYFIVAQSPFSNIEYSRPSQEAVFSIVPLSTIGTVGRERF
jgi:hypothetical protein